MLVLHVPHMQDNPNPVLLTTHSKTYQVLIKVLQASLVSVYLETRRVEIEERAISVHQSVYKRNARFFFSHRSGAGGKAQKTSCSGLPP